MVARHCEFFSLYFSRPVPNEHVLAFNAFNIGNISAQGHLAMQLFKIKDGCRVAILDDPGFTPGRDLCCVKRHRVTTSGTEREVIGRTGFKYPYWILIIAAIFAVATSVCCNVVFRAQRQPMLSNGPAHREMIWVVTRPWKEIWRKFVTSVHTNNFHKVMFSFIPTAQTRASEG